MEQPTIPHEMAKHLLNIMKWGSPILTIRATGPSLEDKNFASTVQPFLSWAVRKKLEEVIEQTTPRGWQENDVVMRVDGKAVFLVDAAGISGFFYKGQIDAIQRPKEQYRNLTIEAEEGARTWQSG